MSTGRALALLAAGLFIGSLVSLMAASTLQRREAVPRSTMTLMQYHLTEARKTSRSNSCDAVAASGHLDRLRHLAIDAKPVFAVIGYDDPVFERHRQSFLKAVDQGLAGGADCAAISAQLKPISESCDGCHHETR